MNSETSDISVVLDNLYQDIYLNNIDNNLYLLPDDLKRNIYIEYFEPTCKAQDLCNNLITLLSSKSSRQLDIKPIVPLLTLILDNKYAIDYLLENYIFEYTYNKKKNLFKILYEGIIINKKRNFINFDIVSDFALSWLYSMYH